ncbi:hypothetical protein [Streptomyces griseus]|uniref:hypothetical protein n=1 Tax=Streptomyces griseus TaxID=1911 RepID=UPI0036E34238
MGGIPVQFSPKVIATGLAAAVALGAGVVGTAQASAAQTAPPAAVAVKKAASAEEDGRALFGGLVFTQGRVADSLIAGGYYRSSKETLKENRGVKSVAAVGKLMDVMEKTEPGFFAGLSADLRSGDPRRVEAALDHTSALLKNHVKVIEKSGDGSTGACVAVVVAVNVAVVGNVVAVYNAEVAWDVQHFWMEQRPMLSAEESIALLTTLLKDA